MCTHTLLHCASQMLRFLPIEGKTPCCRKRGGPEKEPGPVCLGRAQGSVQAEPAWKLSEKEFSQAEERHAAATPETEQHHPCRGLSLFSVSL